MLSSPAPSSPPGAPAPAPAAAPTVSLRFLLLFVAWYVVSTSYSMLAKMAFTNSATDRPTALALTFWQCVCGVLGGLALERGRVDALRGVVAQGGPLLAVIALANFVGAYLTSTAMGAGSVAVAYIVKATEPLFVVALSWSLLSARFGPQTLGALVPLCAGLVMACWQPSPGGAGAAASIISLGSAMAIFSNVGMGFRNVLTKLQMQGGAPAPAAPDADPEKAQAASAPASPPAPSAPAPKPSAAVVFGAVSLYSALYAGLLCLADPLSAAQALQAPLRAFSQDTWTLVMLAAASHAAYTLCSFTVLESLSPASHAIANSMKHVVVIGAASLFLGAAPSLLQALGAIVAIVGVLLYNRASDNEKDLYKSPILVPPAVQALLASFPSVALLVFLVLTTILLLVVWPESSAQ
jgi:drug/metabolite transporter (DMT)-like permease